MRHLDLFSGIGGFAFAAREVWGPAHEIVSFCEIEPFCQKVLKKHWPNVPCHDDIKTLGGAQLGTIDIITGGFPCQPFSCAGKQGGEKDDRFLWPEMLRIISEAKPTWVIGENVAGFVRMELDNCITDLESKGYEVQTLVIPACGVGAQHKRDRCWIIAYTDSNWKSSGPEHEQWEISRAMAPAYTNKLDGDISRHGASKIPQFKETKVFRNSIPNSDRTGCQTGRSTVPQDRKKEMPMSRHPGEYDRRHEWALTESPVCGTDDGVSSRVDRIKGLGNAIVPQVVIPIMQAIKDIDDERRGKI